MRGENNDSDEHKTFAGLRMCVAKDELWLMLENRDTVTRPLLVLANKCDERGALSAIEVSQQLSLDRIQNRKWHVCATTAVVVRFFALSSTPKE